MLTISLIILSTVLFVTGTLIERGRVGGTPTGTHQDTPSGATSSGDADGGHEEISSASPKPGAETIFGFDLENPLVVTAFALVWLGLIVVLLRVGRLASWILLFLSILSAVLDGGEVGRQYTQANLPIAIVASGVLMAHVALAVLAIFVVIRTKGGVQTLGQV